MSAVEPFTRDTPAGTPTGTSGRRTIDLTDPEWWKSSVVYQVYPRSFADSDGDGVGDLRGLTSRLDHLERLGIDVIWLSPVYPSPQADNGYDIRDYRNIDPIFGTLDDFDDLLTKVHARGMKLIMDLVVNHTSDEHPWFRESRSSVDDARRDWYWWRPPRACFTPGQPGAEPNNWESFFGGPSWTYDNETGQYYLHLFDPKQPDLNWENPAVRQAVHETMTWWLDRGVDGFRMDVINLISKRTDLPDGARRSPEYPFGDGFPYVLNGPRVHEFLQEIYEEVFAGRREHYLTVAETPGATLDDAVLYTDPSRREVNMIFQFEHVSLDHGSHKFDGAQADPQELVASLDRWQTGLGDRGWNSLYLGNHDQPRSVSRFGDAARYWRESSTALATMTLLLRGTPYIYQGEELGMTNFPFDSIDQFRDIESLNYAADAADRGLSLGAVIAGLRKGSRDNARTPMQWSAGKSAGFTSGDPWMDVNPNHSWLNAQAQYDDPASVFNYFRALVDLRHRNPVATTGRYAAVATGSPQAFAFSRTSEAGSLLVVCNLAGSQALWEGPPIDVTLSNYTATERRGSLLSPWEARVYELDAKSDFPVVNRDT